jgi:putative restriction endonuclease
MEPNRGMVYFLQKFTRLRLDRTGGWGISTSGQAPHKPFLLLSVMDLFAQGLVRTNVIEITAELGELFASYWSKVMPPDRRGNMALPFFHLRSSGFWHLLPFPGQETALDLARQVNTLNQLGKLILGVRLDEELFNLLQVSETRNALRMALIQTYFSQDYHSVLMHLGDVNLQTFEYSQHLIEQARQQAKETPGEENAYQAVRDQGFRKAIVRIYDHRCALCGVRMLTTDGRTAVDAAHIIPWSVSHNDDPHNGMALCGLCHWTFDQGLVGVSTKYLVLLSDELQIVQNVAGHLLTLESRSIIGPQETDLWPFRESLEWHQYNIFRSG